MVVPFHLLTVLGLFGIGGSCLVAGIVAQMPVLMYTSGGISGATLLLSIYLFLKDRRRPPPFENPVFPTRLYRDPGMKKNKSDTNLELMGVTKNVTDDGEIGPSDRIV
jgi:hypothetical protein